MLSRILETSQLRTATEKLRVTLKHHAYRQQKVEWGTPAGRSDEFDTYVLRAKSHDISVGMMLRLPYAVVSMRIPGNCVA